MASSNAFVSLAASEVGAPQPQFAAASGTTRAVMRDAVMSARETLEPPADSMESTVGTGASLAAGAQDLHPPQEMANAPELDVREANIYLLDDEMANVVLLQRMLQGAGYKNLRSATDSRQGMRECIENPPDLLMLDLMMPHLDGYAVMETLRAAWGMDNPIPILVLTADASRAACRRALMLGASDFVNKPIDMMEMRLRARNLLGTRLLAQKLRAVNAQLEERVRERTRDLERINLDLQESQTEALEKLAQAAEFRDDDTGEHIQRVGNGAGLLARQLGLSSRESDLIRRAAPLHDIGKIAIPDSILLKPGKLTNEEFDAMKTHAKTGAELLSRSRSPLMQRAEIIARTHHERFDGTGYPANLAGENIPIEGRIAAVIDVFDALTHERPYKAAWPIEEALGEIQKCAGAHFDPRVVEAFCQLNHASLI